MIKSKNAKISIGAIILVIVIAAIAAYYWKSHTQPPQETPQMPAPSVTIGKPVTKTVERYYDFTGNVEPVASVEIRARIEGYLQNINFVDGSFVEKGQLLFVIEPQQYEAKLEEAKAAVASAKAQLNSAEADLERVEKAVKSNAVSLEEVSRRKAQMEVAQASLEEAKAALENTKIELSYTKIQSPISGKISKRYVDEGNLVGAGENTLLAEIVSTDPVYVTFEMSENILAEYVRANNITRNENPKSPVFVAAPTEKEYTHKGTLDYIGNKVNQTTGTIDLRATVENSDGSLYPGMFARIRMPGEKIENAILVEESAIGTNLGGKYVLTVNDKNIVSLTQIVPGQSYGQLRIVKSGLAPDQRYVTRGLQKARPGREITPMPAGKDKSPEQETKDNRSEE
jgi:RND family efflux transporter MFP subunit